MGKTNRSEVVETSLLYDANLDENIVLELTKKVYHPDNLIVKNIEIEIHKNRIFNLSCEKYINDNQSYKNGLQAGLYGLREEKKLYLVIRGADVGAGKKIFHIFNANDKFIPKSVEENSWRTLYQDWIYSTLLGSLGIVRLYQYESLRKFFMEIKEEYPDYQIIVGGHSLGGLLAQKLYLQESGITRCITFAGLSPWWTLNSQTQDMLKKYKFLENSERMVNFYSDHDPARYYPLFTKYIGKQNNVLLEPFQSRSNILATFLERIYWAHVPNYYIFKDNKIKVKSTESKFNKVYNNLNTKIKYNTLINITLISVLTFLFSVFIFMFNQQVPSNIMESYIFLENIISNNILMFLLIFIGVVILLLPTLLVKSKWKIILIIINLSLFSIIILWPVLLSISVILNRICVEENYE